MKNKFFSPITILIGVMLLMFFSPSIVLAQIETRMRVVYASNVGSTIDPSLGDLHSQLGSVFNFTSYRLLTDVNLLLVGNKPAEVFVHRDGSIELTFIGKQKDLAELRIRMKRKGVPILNTQVRLSSGKMLFIGGPLYREGVAIIALSARF
jgi:hypothetical protein